MGEHEVPLTGGIANQGAIVRVGDTVRRPQGPASAAVHALLTHLESVGFVEVPRFLGTDERGREVLSFIEGEAYAPPFRGWVSSDAALEEAACLLRRYHDALGDFHATRFAGWCQELADPHGGDLACHNDVCVENVVFRDGRAVGLIDFDFAAPGRGIWDAAMAARMWAPLAHPEWRHAWPRGLDVAGRLAAFAAAYGLDADAAEEFVDAVVTSHQVGQEFVLAHVAAGETAFVEMWQTYHGDQRRSHDQTWITDARPGLVAAVAAACG